MKKLIHIFLSVALTGFSLTAFAEYQCGPVPSGSDPSWCSCYYENAMSQCQAEGGGDSCSDKFLRDLTAALGGPEAICEMAPPDVVGLQECIDTLTHYISACPAR